MRVTTRTFPDPQNLCPVPVTEYTLQNDHGISVSTGSSQRRSGMPRSSTCRIRPSATTGRKCR